MKRKEGKPNMKNKSFVQWQRPELCRIEDNLVSSDWHEKLKKMGRFQPVYDNKPLNMVYLLSGEYGRIWMKERDEWFKASYTPEPRAEDLEKRKKKIRVEARAAKKAAQVGALERKKRREMEKEAKAKAKAEELERLKERVRKLAAPKLTPKPPKTKKKTQPQPPPEKEETKDDNTCPKGCTQIELTLQCNGQDVKEEKENQEINEEVKEDQKAPPVKQTEESKDGCVMCEGYMEQMKAIHEKNVKEANEEPEHSPEAH